MLWGRLYWNLEAYAAARISTRQRHRKRGKSEKGENHYKDSSTLAVSSWH
jgi:hypothetical protein